jgi:hypothetical protein
MLAAGTTLPNSLPIEEVVIWIRLLLQFCSDFGELGRVCSLAIEQGTHNSKKSFPTGFHCAVQYRVRWVIRPISIRTVLHGIALFRSKILPDHRKNTENQNLRWDELNGNQSGVFSPRKRIDICQIIGQHPEPIMFEAPA